ncbi:zf-HC2 domain-containing protein [Solirubrobacter phytolaccae]|uniref:Zf-HC2 domain-containing protein n=1 Tax=Solirubrobacter phytolaccae TaxID=1404360 RepID=A0A9X3SBH3_9ACTN|nr:zf-HC2 domain-containing protein [Solirubrobacter phytolaccae]MDA0183621.1 zf-HC2 domain-containing protein [Solirubrobacter phytolaccae]
MIRCRELVELVTVYLDGVLPAHEREHVDAHLKQCEGCTAYLAQVDATLVVLRRVAER